MPSFDVVSRVDLNEVRNAVDQTAREIATRFDFKDTGTSATLGEADITLRSTTEARLKAALQVLEEKLVRRKVPLKALGHGRVEDAAGGTKRQVITINQGISTDQARAIVKHIKGLGVKVQAAVQGDEVRISGKKRDELQDVMQSLREADFGVPLQFTNRRD